MSATPAGVATPSSPEIQLLVPSSHELWAATGRIFRDYAASLPIDLSFQGFEEELSRLDEHYAQPQGGVVLALVDGQVAGCGAFRPLPDVDHPNACEMKRLYVRPAFRRLGLGRLVAERLIGLATQAGYSNMLLDTLDDMEVARSLYGSLGFQEVAPCYFNPLPGAHYLCVRLGP